MSAEKLAEMPLRDRLFFMDRLIDGGFRETFYARAPENQQKIWTHLIEDFKARPAPRKNDNQRKIAHGSIAMFILIISVCASKTIIGLTVHTIFLWWCLFFILTVKLGAVLTVFWEFSSMAAGMLLQSMNKNKNKNKTP